MTATLCLLIDAIPHGIAAQAWRDGHLPGFDAPRPMVSVFPSLTNIAVPALLRGVIDVVPPGYEAKHWDPVAKEVRGGLHQPDSEPGMAPYHGSPSGALGHLAIYALRAGLVRGHARWIGRRFRREGGPWLGYVAATDGVAHFGGEERLLAAFAAICDRVTEAADAWEAEHGEPARVVLCSDHGCAFGELKHLAVGDLERRLRLSGFRPGEVGGTGVMLVPMGDVGGGAAWCEPAAAPELAEAIVEMPGVGVAFAATRDGARAFGVNGEGMAVANLRRRGDDVSYEPVTGDPLGLLETFEEVSGGGRWADDRALFAATADHPYPDAVHRVIGGFQDVCRYPGQVLFSMRDDWTWGPATTHLAAGVMGGQRGTHGALTARQSRGFAAVRGGGPEAARAWSAAPALRPEDVFAPFADDVRAGAAPRS